MTPIGRHLRLLAFLAAGVAMPFSGAFSQGSTTAGYATDTSQTVQSAPPGSVGRKTTDRVHRVGNVEGTLGNETTHVMTFGGFVRSCPTADGVVEGNYEYALIYDGVETTDDGEMLRAHEARGFSARLEGHVTDEGWLDYVDLEGTYSSEKTGTGLQPSSQSRPVRKTFRPGMGGEPDWKALGEAADETGDLAVAAVVLMAGTLYKAAELEWRKDGTCVEFSFDPPTETRSLGPNESLDVHVELRTKTAKLAVPWKSSSIGVIDGEGKVAPTRAEARPGSPATLTYTASAKPRKGHGIDLATESRAGLAGGKWKINALARYEGTFTQTDEGSIFASNGLAGAEDVATVTGHLIWTPEAGDSPSAPTFGDVHSTVYRPTGGEISLDVQAIGQSFAGACLYGTQKSFPIAQFSPAALRYFLLEIADDGRYKLSLGLSSQFLQTTVEVSCGRGGTETLPLNSVAVTIGVQQGTLNADEDVVGALPMPIRRGARTTTGEWSFKKTTP